MVFHFLLDTHAFIGRASLRVTTFRWNAGRLVLGILAISAAMGIGSGCSGRYVFHETKASMLGENEPPTRTLFSYDALAAQPPEEILLESTQKSYSVFRIHFPDRPCTLFPNQGMTAHEYRPEGKGQQPGAGVLILPIQGGDYEVSTYFAEYFASKGISCLRFERRADWLVPERPLEQMALLIREYVVDIRRGLAWWQTSGHVDPERIGLFGVSMGAIIGSMVTALERSNLKASVLVLAGGSIADILMTADDEEINEVRRLWLERVGTRDRLDRELHQVLDPVDPLRLAPMIPVKSTLMIQARFDHVVRYPLSTSIWRAAGKPGRVVIPTGHYSSVFLIHYIRWKARKWFERKLSVTHDEPMRHPNE